jgi:flagellar assembly protein FliH
MTQAAFSPRPFVFDTEFASDGEITRMGQSYAPTKRAYLPAEVEALIAQARLEAREAALAEVESLQAMALVGVSQAIAAAAPALAGAAQTHRVQSAELAMACGRVIAGAVLDRFPTGPLQEALEQLGAEIDATPRLVIRTRGLDQTVQAKLQALCVDAGFQGLVVFRDKPGLPEAAFQLEWADGRADFDPNEAAQRMGAALAAALAAEAGHAETLDGNAY